MKPRSRLIFSDIACGSRRGESLRAMLRDAFSIMRSIKDCGYPACIGDFSTSRLPQVDRVRFKLVIIGPPVWIGPENNAGYCQFMAVVFSVPVEYRAARAIPGEAR